MTKILINPAGIDAEYLTCLNKCFRVWGDQAKFDWYFRRQARFPADLIVFADDGRVVAGSGITYRQLKLPNAKTILAGIMTGSWTLPEEQRKGYFNKMIQESRRVVARKRGALLLAFVTQDNASSRGLTKAGAALFPTRYLFSSTEFRSSGPIEKTNNLRESAPDGDHLFDRRAQTIAASTHVHYETQTDFRRQFLERPQPVEILSDEDGNIGVVEIGRGTEALQLLLAQQGTSASIKGILAAFAQRAALNRRQFFFFTSDDVFVAAGEAIGLQSKLGYIAALVADEAGLRDSLAVPGNAELAHAQSLADPSSAWFIGRWALAGGDRA